MIKLVDVHGTGFEAEAVNLLESWYPEELNVEIIGVWTEHQQHYAIARYKDGVCNTTEHIDGLRMVKHDDCWFMNIDFTKTFII